MDKELQEALIIIVAVAFSRVLSHYEHKKTEKQVSDMHTMMNGETIRKIADAYQQGRQDQIKAEKGL